ncbi:MAG: hypothetical protein ABIL62_04930 [Planctomycetota bacterium]
MRKQLLCLLLCASIFLAGCAGRDPNPIALKMPGDADLSCNALQAEMENLSADMKVLKPKTNKFLTNTIWFLLWTPLMDVKEAEKIEYNAMQRRHNHLLVIAKEKECDFADSVEPVEAVE